jgi:ABC-type lipoprotein export system ATPase subunit
MKLRSFEIDTYRSCLRTKFTLHDELTGLIGVNGSGKSNILNALTLLKKIYRSRPPTRDMAPSSRSKCHIRAEIEHQNKTLWIKGDVEYETDERNVDEVYSADLRFNFREFTGYSNWLSIPIQFLSYSRQFVVVPDEPRLETAQMTLFRYFPFRGSGAYNAVRRSRKIRQLLLDIADFFDGINYYSASQFSDVSQCPVSIELEENRPLRRFRGVRHEQFILDLYKSFKADDTQYRRYLNTVSEDGIGLVDKIGFTEVDMPSHSYEVKIGGKITKFERNRHLIVPRFTINNADLSPNQLSEGTFKTLALVYYILTDDSRLLLIEEPEVCVHHGLLSSVISLIEVQSKQKQIVMSTHSDFVLDHLQPENLVLVKRSPEKGTIAKPLNRSMSKNHYESLRVYLKESGNLGEYWKEGGFDRDV